MGLGCYLQETSLTQQSIAMKITERALQIAIARYYDTRKHIVVPNVSHAFFNHECDVLVLTASGYATEIEIKISAADLRKDFTKRKHQIKRPDQISRLFYCVPEKLLDLAMQIIPEQYGIITFRLYEPLYAGGPERLLLKQQRQAEKRLNSKPWSDKDKVALLRNFHIKSWDYIYGKQ